MSYSEMPETFSVMRPTEDIEGLADLGEVYRAPVVSVSAVDALLRTLRRRSVLGLSKKLIKSRRRSLATLPSFLRRLRRQAVMAERKLRELEAHSVIDDEFLRLSSEREFAFKATRHDA
jgi:hypothetical protein